MKSFSAVALAFVGMAAASSAQKSTVSTVPSGAKTYVAGLRKTIDGDNFCAASLISATHLLTGIDCVGADIRWASIGSHYSNGTQDGEQLKVVAILNHPGNSYETYENDFAILVLEKPSSFKPVALASANAGIKANESASKIGWNYPVGAAALDYEMTSVAVQLISSEECAKTISVDATRLCSRGVANVTSCAGAYGSPVVVERPTGDVLVGVVSWGNGCNRRGNPNVYSRVSSAHPWVESVVGGVCFQ
jgi:secreted trypsin-like serine protease